MSEAAELAKEVLANHKRMDGVECEDAAVTLAQALLEAEKERDDAREALEKIAGGPWPADAFSKDWFQVRQAFQRIARQALTPTQPSRGEGPT
jgi:hypothetical protein